MKLTDYINPESIKIDLDGEDKEEVIQELVEVLVEGASRSCGEDAIYDSVMKREREGSTGLEKGIAIPHAKCDEVERLEIAIGISGRGIDFDAQDGRPSHLFFLMIAPSNEAGPHVQAIARIIKMLEIPGVRERLMKAGNAEKVYQIIEDVENGG